MSQLVCHLEGRTREMENHPGSSRAIESKQQDRSWWDTSLESLPIEGWQILTLEFLCLASFMEWIKLNWIECLWVDHWCRLMSSHVETILMLYALCSVLWKGLRRPLSQQECHSFSSTQAPWWVLLRWLLISCDTDVEEKCRKIFASRWGLLIAKASRLSLHLKSPAVTPIHCMACNAFTDAAGLLSCSWNSMPLAAEWRIIPIASAFVLRSDEALLCAFVQHDW